MDFEIISLDFESQKSKPIKEHEPVKSLLNIQNGTNWPVVYILHNTDSNDKNLYVGESTSASQRMKDHIRNSIRACFNKVKIIFDPTYNKSAVLDIEQTLINLFVADGQYKLQNANEGQSDAHEYYDRAYYQKLVGDIWEKLKNNKFLKINKHYNELVNSELFKFSPYTSLTMEQNEVCMDILKEVLDSLDNKKKYLAMVQGGPGTGKSIVMMHMFHMLQKPEKPNARGKISTKTGKEDETWKQLVQLKEKIYDYKQNYNQNNSIKVAYVCPMGALQSTIKNAVKAAGIAKKNVMKPIDVSKFGDNYFDVIFVDEAHRLAHTPIGNSRKAFDDTNKKLFGANSDTNGKKYTQLDWLLKKSRCVVMVFDEGQTVRDSDITVEERDIAFNRVNVKPVNFELKGQMRCNGGSLYTDFVRQMLNPDGSVPAKPDVGHYDLKVFDKVTEMIETICDYDKDNKLCRVATGFGWQWIAKRYEEAKQSFSNIGDWSASKYFAERTAHYLEKLKVKDGLIELEGKKYVRNIDPDRWTIECDPHEIGCVHTTQGFDYNYIGVIFGPEIDFDPATKRVFVDFAQIADKNSLSTTSVLNGSMSGKDKAEREEQIKQDVLNVYNVLLTRGIRGCYMWACNPNMQQYLKDVINGNPNIMNSNNI